MKINRILFKCVKQAIEIGGPYMRNFDYLEKDQPTQQEWDLALVLFKHELNKEVNKDE